MEDERRRVLDNPAGTRATVMIVAGYEQKLKTGFWKADAGLQRRFPHKFVFSDYTPHELRDILLHRIRAIDRLELAAAPESAGADGDGERRAGVPHPEARTEDALLELIEKNKDLFCTDPGSSDGDYCNGGGMETLLQRAQHCCAAATINSVPPGATMRLSIDDFEAGMAILRDANPNVSLRGSPADGGANDVANAPEEAGSDAGSEAEGAAGAADDSEDDEGPQDHAEEQADTAEEQARAEVERQVRAEVESQVRAEMERQVHAEMERHVRAEVESQVRAEVEQEIDAALNRERALTEQLLHRSVEVQVERRCKEAALAKLKAVEQRGQLLQSVVKVAVAVVSLWVPLPASGVALRLLGRVLLPVIGYACRRSLGKLLGWLRQRFAHSIWRALKWILDTLINDYPRTFMFFLILLGLGCLVLLKYLWKHAPLIVLVLILLEHHVLVSWLLAPPTVDGGPRVHAFLLAPSGQPTALSGQPRLVNLRLCILAIDQVPLPYAEMSLSQQMACNVDAMAAECRRACHGTLWTACPAQLQRALGAARMLLGLLYNLELDFVATVQGSQAW